MSRFAKEISGNKSAFTWLATHCGFTCKLFPYLTETWCKSFKRDSTSQVEDDSKNNNGSVTPHSYAPRSGSRCLHGRGSIITHRKIKQTMPGAPHTRQSERGTLPSSPGDGFAEGVHTPCKWLPGLLLQDVTTEHREVHLPRHGSEPRPLGLYPTS